MEISAKMPLSGALLKWTGFDAVLGASQPPEVFHRMREVGLMPHIAISVIAFTTSCFMPIAAKMMEKVRAELDARRAAGGMGVSTAASDPSSQP